MDKLLLLIFPDYFYNYVIRRRKFVVYHLSEPCQTLFFKTYQEALERALELAHANKRYTWIDYGFGNNSDFLFCVFGSTQNEMDMKFRDECDEESLDELQEPIDIND